MSRSVAKLVDIGKRGVPLFLAFNIEVDLIFFHSTYEDFSPKTPTRSCFR